MLLKLVLPLLILVGTLPIARADDASKRAKIQELFQITNARQAAEEKAKLAMADFDSDLSQQFARKNLTADEKLQLKKLYTKINRMIADDMNWDQLEPQYAKVYADAFTEQQIDDMIAFFETPTGKALSEKRPMLLGKLGVFMRQRWINARPQIHQAIGKFEAEVSAKRPKSMSNR